MRTDFSPEYLATDKGARANEILRACVHCGFCNATCPTYQLTGDELDGPRGRIYLIKELLTDGGNEPRATQHLDRCLTCRACETTCPSGVAYGELAEIAREHLGPERPGWRGLQRRWLQWMVPYPRRLRLLARLGGWFRWLLPRGLADHLPRRVGRALKSSGALNSPVQGNVLLLNGCAQQVSTAGTNEHLSRLLANRGVAVVTLDDEACCGALDLHLGEEQRALEFARHNVDRVYPLLQDLDAVVSSASGCGVNWKDFGRLLSHDADYAKRAQAVSDKTLDASEYLSAQGFSFEAAHPGRSVAWQSPCSLQHGQQITGTVEQLLIGTGYTLTPVPDGHLCCGSAGTYSLLQPVMSEQLKQNKLDALNSGEPDLIATANVGCQSHLQTGSSTPVMHWVELLQ